MFTEEFQVEFLTEYHKVFDSLKKEFLVGEMVWNFADFMTVQRNYISIIYYKVKFTLSLFDFICSSMLNICTNYEFQK